MEFFIQTFIIDILATVFGDFFMPSYKQQKYKEILGKNFIDIKNKIPLKIRESFLELILKMYDIKLNENEVIKESDAKMFLKKILNNNEKVIIFKDEEIVKGCILLNKNKKDNNDKNFYENDCLVISNMYVLPTFRDENVKENIFDLIERIANLEKVDEIIYNFENEEWIDISYLEKKLFKKINSYTNMYKKKIGKNIEDEDDDIYKEF